MKKFSVPLLVVTAAFLIDSPAVAQSTQMQDLLRKKYEIEQQKADAETRRAEAAAAAAASQQRQASRTRSSPQPAHALTEGDPLENTDAKKCRLSGGATIRVSGSFRPSPTTKCQRPAEEGSKEDEASPE